MKSYGVALTFASPKELIEATRKIWDLGYRSLETYSPYPLDEIDEIIKLTSRLPLIALICGFLGGAAGFFLQYFTAVLEYPLNVGGHPLNSWPSFIPVTFELTVLGAGVGIFTGFFVFSKLPAPYHPVFSIQDSERISDDLFVLCLEAQDPLFNSSEVRQLISNFRSEEIVYGEI